MNQVLMTKLCWIFNTGSNLVSRLVKEKYIDNRTYPTVFLKGSHIWQNVRKGWDLYQRLTALCIGDGTHINFWHDNWSGKETIRSLVAGPLNKGEEDQKLNNVMRNGNWNPNTLSFTLPTDLLLRIHAIPIPQFGEDVPFCSLIKGLKFDSKTTYNIICKSKFPDLLPNGKWSCIWKDRCKGCAK